MRLSVIIPVYNAEKYIEKCLNSIIPQLTLEDEIILINASSTDKTEEICSSYVKENNNIKKSKKIRLFILLYRKNMRKSNFFTFFYSIIV